MEEIDPHKLQLIDKFLLGNLQPDDQKIWEEAMQQKAFQEELVYRRDLMAASKAIRRDQMMKELVELDHQHFTQESDTVGKIRSFRFLIGTSIAAAIVIVFLLWNPFGAGPTDHQALFAEHFSPYPNHLVMVTRDTGLARTKLEHVFSAYEQERFNWVVEAIGKLDSVDLDRIPPASLQLYLGVSLLGANQSNLAIEELRTLVDLGEEVYSPPAEWYLSLAYLRSGDLDKSQSTLLSITKQLHHPFRDEARELLAVF
ncbi:MAG: hypothetical protein AAF587_00965 [Bacteroidota bacterium]